MIGLNNIGADGATAIADALQVNHTLTTLEISTAIDRSMVAKIIGSNKIDVDGAKAMGAALRRNYTLTYLDIGIFSLFHNLRCEYCQCGSSKSDWRCNKSQQYTHYSGS